MGTVPLQLKARVVRVESALPEGGRPTESSVALEFSEVTRKLRSSLLALQSLLQSGPPRAFAALDQEPVGDCRPQVGLLPEFIRR